MHDATAAVPLGTRSTRFVPWLASALAVLLWFGSARVFFTRDPHALGRLLAAEQLDVIESGRSAALRAPMRQVNPEWDFMGRTFAALTLVNTALAQPGERERALAALDALIAATLAEDRQYGASRFLLPYAHRSPFQDPSGGNLFVDGEIALVLAARQYVHREPRYDDELGRRIERMTAQMQAGPVLSGESYPDECWTFDNTTALAALRVYDAVYGADHGAYLQRWVKLARQRLIDPATGMLVSSYRYDGTHLDGPEGSTLWMVAHNLRLIDRRFAHEQYALAKRHFARSALGFGWASEWLAGHERLPDVDSGPVIPGLEISAGASGLAFIGAGAFGDREYQAELVRSLTLGGFPVETEHGLRFAASNQVADAVLAYGLSQGPLWNAIGAREETR